MSSHLAVSSQCWDNLNLLHETEMSTFALKPLHISSVYIKSSTTERLCDLARLLAHKAVTAGLFARLKMMTQT